MIDGLVLQEPIEAVGRDGYEGFADQVKFTVGVDRDYFEDGPGAGGTGIEALPAGVGIPEVGEGSCAFDYEAGTGVFGGGITVTVGYYQEYFGLFEFGL